VFSPAESGRNFIEWVGDSLTPFSSVRLGPESEEWAPLGETIGDAPVVALSEGVHCAAEPLEFRNRLLEYLVREKGFTAIAIESGVAECRAIHEYVRSGPGDLNDVVAHGISWTFDQLPQNRALVQWLRDYNDEPGQARQINWPAWTLRRQRPSIHASRLFCGG
jgi:erythromycin esterase-like protein